MEGLRDIKGVVEIDEPSLQILLLLTFVTLLLLAFALYRFKNRRRRRKKVSPKALAKARLEGLNYDNTKEVVYGFLEDALPFVNEKNEAMFKQIEQDLAPYKYKKEVPPLEEGLKKEIKSFIEGVKA